MFQKSCLLIFAFFMLLSPFTAIADQAYGGLGLVTSPGEPQTNVNRFSIHGAYETLERWRFSFTDTSFKDEATGTVKANSQILGGEHMWINSVNEGFALIGAVGAGFYRTSVTGGGGGSGFAVGLLATGSGRFAISKKLFIDLSLQYRNAAVSVGNYSIDAGYTGLALNLGAFF